MSATHQDIPPELLQLAQSILDRLDPAVRMAAARATSGADGKCQQVWCPVCALGALVTGERHPLLTVIAEHSVALLTVVRAMTDAMDTGQDPAAETGPSGPDPSSPDDDPPPAGPGHYEHIPVTVED
ncbi:hypothetical protein [Mycolicibacterium sp. 050158]|uniref:hypothetical protein n=1 Tax=Mycolicibacterium sp. 050158 TaxID=3090602 RepID=UPI00299E9476|nr:hypothetical protein [Mycolicibacterium sp. 050158]MDX1893264.1 hypothetical protein [Mycolicibacterium sp. 050158]